MAITTLDQLVAAYPGRIRHYYRASATARAAGAFHSLWSVGGFPGAGTTPPTGNGAIPTNTTAGAIPIVNPSGSNKLYLARFSASCSNSSTLVLYDRLWHNSGFAFNVTTAQTISTPPTLTRPDSLGEGVELWGEVYAASGTTASTITATYTNSAGTSGRTATYAKPGAALVVGEMFPFNLASGDTGVRTVSQVQLSASTGSAGNFGLVLLRRIAEIPVIANVMTDRDLFMLGMPEIYPDSCLAVFVQASTTTTGVIVGSVLTVEG